jgi:hypothetical protein
VCAAIYVALSLTNLDGSGSILQLGEKLVSQNIFLALGTLFYGGMVASLKWKSTKEAYRCLYRSEKSLLSGMDLVANAILPVLVAVFGFFVVLQSESYLSGVMNVVALFFITDIDDQLPRLLEMDTADIVQGFLIDKAMEEYETQNQSKLVAPIEFSDIHVTNTKESGSVPRQGITLQPYEFFGAAPRSNGDGESDSSGSSMTRGLQVANKRSVTTDCLLRKIEWQYTGGFDDSSLPRIGHLRLQKLVDDSLVEIVGKQKDDSKPWFCLTGVYIISSFSMSDDILRLRITGSQNATDFLQAFQYYSLWPVSPSALELLKAKRFTLTTEEKLQNKVVLHGGAPRAPPITEGEEEMEEEEDVIDRSE